MHHPDELQQEYPILHMLPRIQPARTARNMCETIALHHVRAQIVQAIHTEMHFWPTESIACLKCQINREIPDHGWIAAYKGVSRVFHRSSSPFGPIWCYFDTMFTPRPLRATCVTPSPKPLMMAQSSPTLTPHLQYAFSIPGICAKPQLLEMVTLPVEVAPILCAPRSCLFAPSQLL
jgi:hypothetical protein